VSDSKDPPSLFRGSLKPLIDLKKTQSAPPDPDVETQSCPGCGTLAYPDEPCPACGRPPADHRVGEVIGEKYRLEALIGAGGMGRVYRAIHKDLNEPVAVKFLLAEWSERAEMRARFRREAVVLARLRHPNIVSVVDYGEHQNELYLVMELLRGFSLDTQVKAGGLTLQLSRVVNIIDQVLQVLEAAHAQGIVHRDLKPENVMLLDAGDRTDRVKVLDFGIAQFEDGNTIEKLTATGTVRGTPHYMSPEQCVGRNITSATDIYAVGAMLYELLVGTPPFNGRSTAEIISQQMFASPPSFAERAPPREVPTGVEALVMRALSKKPEQRPTAIEFRDMLQMCADGADSVTLSVRDAAERARTAGLSRDERALAAEPKVPIVESPANDTGPSPRIALWNFSEERATAIRTTLSVQGMMAFVLNTPTISALSPDKRPWKAIIVNGAADAVERTRQVRATPEIGTLPVIVVDVLHASEAPLLVRAGASDCALATVDDVAVCQKILRALRRGR
jgi:serine/threonine protein kinase